MWEKNVQTFMQKLEQNKNCNNEIPVFAIKIDKCWTSSY